MVKRKNPHAVALGRKGGRVMTPKKLAALKINAQSAGRKPKFQPGDRVVGRDSAPASFRERTGAVVERTHNKSEYWVRFDDRQREPEAVFTWWVDKVEP